MLILICLCTVSAAILLHYAALYRLATLLPEFPSRPHLRILMGISGAFLAHVLEVWVFAAVYFLMDWHEGYGAIEGLEPGEFMGFVYFSFISYTTLGYGEVVPIGEARFLAGLEALVGLMLITWTASFMFLEMQKVWKPGQTTEASGDPPS